MSIVALAALGVVGLGALGAWQVERRAWKLDLIERVDARVHAAPIAAPGPDEWPSITAANAEYRRVALSGRYLSGHETRVQAVTDLGAGFWLLAPFQADAGFVVLVNRGFVPLEWHAETSAATPTQVTGLLRISEPHGAFLRTNDPTHARWYSRDVAAIAKAQGLTNTAPYFVDAEAAPGASADAFPRAGLTVISFRNSHLQYAITWFALAAMLAGGTVYFVRREISSR